MVYYGVLLCIIKISLIVFVRTLSEYISLKPLGCCLDQEL